MARKVSFGLTIPNRGPLIYPGKITPKLLLQLAEEAEELGFESVWVGDSILAKPRYESTSLLSALAARTERVKLGVACMASFPLRHPVITAYIWATLDQLSEGRTILAACMGGGSKEAGGDFLSEFKNLGISYEHRAEILEENIEIIRRLWTEDAVTYDGKFYQLSAVTLEPKPAQKPHPPIWVVSNPFAFRAPDKIIKRGLRRVARLGDGWMTTIISPEQFQQALAFIREEAANLGRQLDGFPACLYYNINITDDEERGLQESKDFLDRYYMTNFDRSFVEFWVACGSREKCLRRIEEFIEAGANVITLRATTTDQLSMVRKVAREILPSF
jgi:alkanesulfonate monooxygenase SsuD/methylene tetrahydromethanopterin reductase-like flavin-dependent oxidoreductase (luciferase family)